MVAHGSLKIQRLRVIPSHQANNMPLRIRMLILLCLSPVLSVQSHACVHAEMFRVLRTTCFSSGQCGEIFSNEVTSTSCPLWKGSIKWYDTSTLTLWCMLSLQMGGISQTVPHKFVEDVRYVQKIVHTWRGFQVCMTAVEYSQSLNH